MIETRGSATLTTTDTPAGYDLAITGVRFENGDLSRPRYLSLFDYERAPEQVTFEPCVQIIRELAPEQTLQFLFQLDPVDGVMFQTRGGEPVVVSAVDPDGGAVPGLTARLLDPFTCELVWNPSLANPEDRRMAALRLLCERPGIVPTAWETVYGGLYLAIVNRPEDEGAADLGVGEPGNPERDTIKLLGSDAVNRPVYDLFQPGVLPAMPEYLCLEPGFLVTGGNPVQLAIRLAPPPEVVLQFEASLRDPREVRVIGYVPPGQPEQLESANRDDAGLVCRMEWVPEQGTGRQVGGRAAFYFEVVAREESGHSRIWAPVKVRHLQIDPTVIQPPTCTGGICV